MGQEQPVFSIVVSTYDRPNSLPPVFRRSAGLITRVKASR